METSIQVAKRARRNVLQMIFKGQSSHIGSNFSCIDILSVFYGLMGDKDKFICSKGWVAASIYFFLAEKGIIKKKELDTYCQEGSRLIGLTEPMEGIEFAGGSMGMGFPAAVGFAFTKRMKAEEGRVYVLMSDGEQNIGTTWESAAIAAHHKLSELRVLVDCNGHQAMGTTEEVLDMSPLKKKWEAFGWRVVECDGHDHKKIEAALKTKAQKPLCILFKTVKGKGVSFMEDDNLYHYKNLTQEEFDNAMKELV